MGSSKRPKPPVYTAIRGDDETAAPVALDNELVQVLALLWRETVEAKVIHHQKIRSQVPSEGLLERAIGARLAEVLEQRVSAGEQDGVTGAHAGCAEALGEHRFADANGTNEDDVLFALQELEREEVLQLAPIELH